MASDAQCTVCQLVESGYQTLEFPFVEVAPPAFRMEVHWTLERLLGYFSTWSATSRYIEATGENPLPALRTKLAPLWGDVNSTRRVAWPLALRIGRTES